MKHLGLTIVLAFAAAGPTCGQSLENIVSITFTKQSRGYVDEMVISRDSVHGFIEDHRRPGESKRYTTEVGADTWMKLMDALKDVPLGDIDGLQSPTMNRAYDGAMHSSIVIAFADGRTVTHSFDNENPHPDLKPLLAAILELHPPSGR